MIFIYFQIHTQVKHLNKKFIEYILEKIIIWWHADDPIIVGL